MKGGYIHMKRIIKLINNERNNKSMLSQKALDRCDSTAHDDCPSIDYGICSLYATDICTKRKCLYLIEV